MLVGKKNTISLDDVVVYYTFVEAFVVHSFLIEVEPDEDREK